MKRTLQISCAAITIVLALSSRLPERELASNGRSDARQSPAEIFQQVLHAHGGMEAIATASTFRGAATQRIMTPSGEYFERSVVVEVDEMRFKREMSDPLGTRTTIDLYDGQGSILSVIVEKDENGQTKRQVASDVSSRMQDIRFSVDSFGLLVRLREFSDPSAISLEKGTAEQLDKFTLAIGAEQWVVLTGQDHLVTELRKGSVSFSFDDYRVVGMLKLPFIQRVSNGGRLAYELYFSSIEVGTAGRFHPSG